MNYLKRLLWKLRFMRSHYKSLSRRVDVENTLLDVANKKRDILTREECRALALKLGTLE